MKAPRASCEGYLTLRTSPSSPPPMLRRYCFLVGTCFYYYSTQEDAYHLMRLKGEVDVLGVQEWDGKGNMHIYQHGFLFATAQNKVFYAYADTAMDKEKWIRAIQMNVETTMSRLAVALMHSNSMDSLSPSASGITLSDAEARCKCPHCNAEEPLDLTAAVTGAAAPAPAAAAPAPAPLLYKCHNCEALYCEKFTTHKVPLPLKSYYYAKRVCDHCYEGQVLINYLKAMVERLKAGICLYPKPLNPETPIELLIPKRPAHTEAGNIAINMLKLGLLTAEECEEILLADRRFRENTVDHPEIPLDLKILALHREFRSRSFSVYRAVILLHRNLDSDPLLFKPIVERLLHFSYTRINQVEFYWPQIVHAYLTVPMFDFDKIFWLDELILSICSRSIHLALLLRWQLQGALEDALDLNAPKDMQDKYARVVRLMLEIEQEVVGGDRAALLGRNSVDRPKKSRLPMPCDDQLQHIQRLTEEIASYREQSQAAANPGNGKSSPYTPVSPSNNGGTQTSDVSEADNRFRDFSRFQQHLLTPRDDDLLGRNDSMDANDASVLEEDMANNQPTSIFSGPMRRMSQSEKSVLAKHFADECEFVEQITDAAEALRFVASIAERKKLLPLYMEKFHLPPMAYVPLVKATDPFERIVRIPTKEGTAFSTKARVPIMLIFEVIRGNIFPMEQQVLSPNSPSRRSCSGSGAIPSTGVEYVEDEEVGRLIRHQSSEAFISEAEESKQDIEPTIPAVEEPAPVVPAVELVSDVPETPIDFPGYMATPSATVVTAKLNQFDDENSTRESRLETTGSASRLDINMSHGNLSEEVLEREKDRRKDLETAFGESWNSKRERLQASSPFGHLPGWDIVSMIGKSYDDLRQEVFTLQLIQKFMEIFKAANLPIWLKCYRIIATSSSTGLIETLINAISLDGLKKREGYVSLQQHFEKSYGPVDSPRYIEARRKFIQSMAGYSLVSYILQIKDRHNGNIMLDNEGHMIHIDYGFLLGIAPGGSFSIETAPFKLTYEMVETMGGPDSDGFKEYIKLCTRGFLACQQHCDEICDLVDIMSRQSPYPCFVGKDVSYILLKLRSRFKLTLSKQETVAHVVSLIRKSNGNYSTRQYDNFQRMTNGIMP